MLNEFAATNRCLEPFQSQSHRQMTEFMEHELESYLTTGHFLKQEFSDADFH